jgi:hypothetical protein
MGIDEAGTLARLKSVRRDFVNPLGDGALVARGRGAGVPIQIEMRRRVA